MTFDNGLKVLTMAAVCMSLVGCYQTPGPETPNVVSVENVPGAPDPARRPKVSILYAQTGTEVTSDGLISQPKSTVHQAEIFYALGVFKGRAKSESIVEIRIVDDAGDTVYRDKKRFLPRGEHRLLFEVRSSDADLAVGQYRIFFALNSVPCWELPLTVQ